MSVKTVPTFLGAALAAIAGAALLTVPSPAGAIPTVPLAPACTLWKLNSNTLSMQMSSGARIDVPWSGSTPGTAAATLDGHGTGYANGLGADSGGHIDFTIVWASPTEVGVTDHFTGEIDPESGRPSGVMAGPDGPDLDWKSSSFFNCAARAPAPKPAPLPYVPPLKLPPQEPAPPPPPEAPKQGPTVSWDPIIGGLVAHITDRSGVSSQCTYTSDFYTRSFALKANSTFDLKIVPAIPKFQNWDVTISCDNGTKTQTTKFF